MRLLYRQILATLSKTLRGFVRIAASLTFHSVNWSGNALVGEMWPAPHSLSISFRESKPAARL